MARIINVQIDVAKINKAKIKENGKYKNYEFALIETPNGKYGQWMVVEKQTKEEREAKKNGTILGNGKNFGWGESTGSSSSSGQSHREAPPISSDDLPF